MTYDLQQKLSIEERILLPDSLLAHREHLEAAIALRDLKELESTEAIEDLKQDADEFNTEQEWEASQKIEALEDNLTVARSLLVDLLYKKKGATASAREFLAEKEKEGK